MPLVGSLGNAAEIAYGPPSDFTPDVFTFTSLFDIEPVDGQGNPTVLYTQSKQIRGVKSALGVKISAVESVISTGLILDEDYSNIGYVITDEIPADVTAETYTNAPGTILPNQYITLRIILEPSSPANNAASFDRDTIFFNDYNPRFSSLVVPESANEAGYNLNYSIDLTLSTTIFNWNVRTRSLDSVPQEFEFTGQELNPPVGGGTSTGSATGINKVVYSNNTATILGLETGYKFLITVDPEIGGISVNEKVAVASTEVSNGDVIYVKSTTPSGYSTSIDHVIEIGSFSTDWQIETEDENLNITFNPTDFTDLLGRNLDAVIESDEITLSGFSPESDLPAQVSGLTTSYYQVEREVVGIGTTVVKYYEDDDIEVQEGDVIKLRMQASSEYSTTVTTTFTVGNTSADWSLTTRDAPPE